MARESIKLTVQKHGNGVRYRRMFKGKIWVSTVYPQDSRRNKSEAWGAFTEWRSNQADGQVLSNPDGIAWRTVIAKIQNSMRELEQTDSKQNREDWSYWFDALQKVQRAIEQGIPYFDDRQTEPAGALDEKPLADWKAEDWEREVPIVVPEPAKPVPANPPWKRHQQISPDITARAIVDQYLQTLEIQVKGGERSVGAYSKIRSALDCFAKWWGDKRGMDTINEEDVRAYHAYMLGIIGEKSRSTVSGYFGAWRTFLDNVCDDNPDIPRPTNLRSRRYAIKAGQSKIEVFTIAECKSLLELASPRVELWLLLMLNCGFYQGDISDLQGSEIDWDAGRIIRGRSKVANAPTINWKLWPQTFKLLQEQGNREGRVLLKQDGNPLLESGIKDNGKEWKRDAVVSSWHHLVKKAIRHKAVPAGWHRTLKQFRKTGATLIESSPHAEFVDTFLDHSRVARRHYLKGQIVPKFDEAVDWLGEQFGLVHSAPRK